MNLKQLSELPHDRIRFAYRSGGKAMSHDVRRDTAAVFFPSLGIEGQIPPKNGYKTGSGQPIKPEALKKAVHYLCVDAENKATIERIGKKKTDEYLNRCLRSLRIR